VGQAHSAGIHIQLHFNAPRFLLFYERSIQMAEGFPLPRSSYKELIKIIGAYGKVPENSVPADVSNVIGINESIISSNNGFLKAVGIIQGGKKKNTTSVGRSLASAYEYDNQPDIAGIWRSLIDSNDFLQKLVAAVRIRKGMDESSLEAHVAYSAGQPKTPQTLTGAGTIVEILKVAGLLKDEGGNLVAVTPESPPSSELDDLTYIQPQNLLSHSVIVPYGGEHKLPTGVQLRIDVKIQCTPQELDGLGEKLRQVVEDFNRQEPKQAAKKSNTSEESA
jgi:hypothetical protein